VDLLAMNEIPLLLAATLGAGTPLAIAGLGLLVNERAGVVNLGAEGLMLVAGVSGFAIAFHSGSEWLALAAGALAGGVVAAGFGWLVIWLNTNQYATGLAVSLFGAGFSAFAGVDYVGRKLSGPVDHSIPVLRDLPFLGTVLFRQHPMVYVAVALAAATAWFLQRTRAGLVLRSIGESPEAAHALGYPVRRIRLLAVIVGGAVCGVAGAYLSVVYTPLWVEGMVAGRGWIALALTVFASWRPARVLLGAYLFGGVTMLQFHLQAQGVQLPSEFMGMLPYLATVVVLVLISRKAAWIRVNMPASLGKPFFPAL
jgi:general nucleoside transport system permease protein